MHNKKVYDTLSTVNSNVQRFGIVALCLGINLMSAKACMALTGKSLDMSIGMYGNEVLLFVAAIAGIMSVVAIAPVIHSRLVTYLGQNTMLLFSWHSRIVIVACGMIYSHFGLFRPSSPSMIALRVCITFFIILIVLIPVNELIKRLPFHKAFGV